MRIETALQARRARVVTIRMTETAMVAARRLRMENIGVLVVKDTCATEGDAVLGVLSERDILQAIVDHGTAAFTMPVSAMMTRAVVFCQSNDTVDRALALMTEHHVRHLPILQNGALIGVVSMRDMLALPNAMGAAAGLPAPALASA